jgi:hypothetical protein
MKSDHAAMAPFFAGWPQIIDTVSPVSRQKLDLGVEKWGLLLPGAPEPRLTLLRRQGFSSVFQAALRSLSNRSIVVVCNYGLAR